MRSWTTDTKRAIRTAGAAVASVAALLVAPAAASAACPNQDVRALLQSEASHSESVLCLINEQRAANGVGPVVRNAKLDAAALLHSRDMVADAFFAHITPDGVDFIDRILDTGYTKGAKGWLVGENLAWGSGSLSTPRQLVTSWMESPPHRANLLRGRFREIGIGAVRGTPQAIPALDGITVTTEYGFRDTTQVKPKLKKRKKGRSARKRASRRS